MASFKRRGKTFTVYYYVTDPATGKRKQTTESGFPTLKAAQAWNTEREHKELTGFKGAPSTMTVADYAAEWLASRRPTDYAESSLHVYRATLKAYILPHLGHIRLTKLDDRQIQSWQAALFRQGLSSGTVVGAHRILSMLCNDAVKRKRIHENPARLAGAPKVEQKPRTKAWSLEEAQRFLAVADSHDDGLVYRFMLMTGVRPGEALTLRWEDIDWRTSTAAIKRTRTRDSEGRHIVGGTTKTPSSRRTITLQPGLADRLRRHRIKQNEHRLRFSDRYHDLGLVFPRAGGTMQNDQTFAQRLARMAARAGVPRISPHGLRHTFGTLAAKQGIYPEAISEQMGHKDIATTMNLYVEFDEAGRRPLLEAFERSFDDSNIENTS